MVPHEDHALFVENGSVLYLALKSELKTKAFANFSHVNAPHGFSNPINSKWVTS